MDHKKRSENFDVFENASHGPDDPKETLILHRGQLIYKRWDYEDEKQSKTFGKWGTVTF